MIDENASWNIELMHSNYKTIYEMYSWEYKEEIKSCNIGLPSGTYYIQIKRGSYLSEIEYSINVNYAASTNWETEFNGTALTSNLIKVNTDFYGSIRSNDDYDWYKFTLPEKGYISVTFKHEMIDDQASWNIELMQSDYKTIYELYSWEYKKEAKSCNIGLPSGTYYIRIIKGSYLSEIEYSINVNYVASANWETEFNETILTADNFALDKPVYGTLRTEKDVDYYSIDIPQTGYYGIYFSHNIQNSGNWTISAKKMIDGGVYDYEGGNFDSISVENVSGKRFVNLTKGINYIKVEKVSGDLSQIDYSLKVSPSFIPQVNITKLKSSKKKQLNVKWGKVSNITGYEIIVATNKKFTKGIKYYYSISSKGNYTVKKLKRKKKYFVKIRAYIIEDGNYYYGEYSKTKAVKVK